MPVSLVRAVMTVVARAADTVRGLLTAMHVGEAILKKVADNNIVTFEDWCAAPRETLKFLGLSDSQMDTVDNRLGVATREYNMRTCRSCRDDSAHPIGSSV